MHQKFPCYVACTRSPCICYAHVLARQDNFGYFSDSHPVSGRSDLPWLKPTVPGAPRYPPPPHPRWASHSATWFFQPISMAIRWTICCASHAKDQNWFAVAGHQRHIRKATMLCMITMRWHWPLPVRSPHPAGDISCYFRKIWARTAYILETWAQFHFGW